jgi:hypothetical protein
MRRVDLCAADVTGVTKRARFAHLAIETARGPHVTPVLFAITADRVWFAIPRATLKARVLARRPRAGALIEDGDQGLVIVGEATLLDPLRPARPRSLVAELARAPFALPAYGARNVGELLGFARDARRSPARAAPYNLVLVSLRAQNLRFVARPPVVAPNGAAGLEIDGLDAISAKLASLVRHPGPAVLGWMGADGPMAVPAGWDPTQLRARVAPGVFEGGDEGPVCVCLDVSHGTGPVAKEGVLVRGHGRVAEDGEAVQVEPERITAWSGFDTATVPSRVRAPAPNLPT